MELREPALVCAGAGRSAPDVHGFGVPVDRLLPTRLRKPERHVEVLVVEDEPFVEATDLLERVSAGECAGGEYGLNLHETGPFLLDRWPDVERVDQGSPQGEEVRMRLRTRPVGIYERRAAQSEPRVLVQSTGKAFDGVRTNEGVTVQQEQPVALRRLDRGVHRRRKPTASRLDDADGRLGGDALDAAVGRGFVRDDDLVDALSGKQRVDTVLEQLAAVAVGDDGRDRHGRECMEGVVVHALRRRRYASSSRLPGREAAARLRTLARTWPGSSTEACRCSESRRSRRADARSIGRHAGLASDSIAATTWSVNRSQLKCRSRSASLAACSSSSSALGRSWSPRKMVAAASTLREEEARLKESITVTLPEEQSKLSEQFLANMQAEEARLKEAAAGLREEQAQLKETFVAALKEEQARIMETNVALKEEQDQLKETFLINLKEEQARLMETNVALKEEHDKLKETFVANLRDEESRLKEMNDALRDEQQVLKDTFLANMREEESLLKEVNAGLRDEQERLRESFLANFKEEEQRLREANETLRQEQDQIKATLKEEQERFKIELLANLMEEESRLKEANASLREEQELMRAGFLATLREEEERMKDSLVGLRAEQENLGRQKTRLTADLSSLDTALRLRREELHDMEARAEDLERRILEGVMDHSRVLLMAKTNRANGRDSMSRKRVVSSGKSTEAVPANGATHEDTKPRTAINLAMSARSKAASGAPNSASGTSRRILSLSQITNNVPTGGIKRSQSVRTPGATRGLRKTSWGNKIPPRCQQRQGLR